MWVRSVCYLELQCMLWQDWWPVSFLFSVLCSRYRFQVSAEYLGQVSAWPCDRVSRSGQCMTLWQSICVRSVHDPVTEYLGQVSAQTHCQTLSLIFAHIRRHYCCRNSVSPSVCHTTDAHVKSNICFTWYDKVMCSLLMPDSWSWVRSSLRTRVLKRDMCLSEVIIWLVLCNNWEMVWDRM